MASLVMSCCSDYNPYEQRGCHLIAPIFDIIGGVALFIIGILIASGTITAGVGALCGVFAAGAFFLGTGLSTLGQWHCRNSGFKCLN
jgi:hypothetical protein